MEIVKTARSKAGLQARKPAPRRLGILPGGFNPPTRAHMALAQAALAHVDEVVLVVPRAYPHKGYEGATLEQRLQMLDRAGDFYSIGISEGGLFIEIASECRAVYGPDTDLWFICGRDAAERIVAWDYRDAGPIENQLAEFGLLVAERGGVYEPPAPLSDRVHGLELPENFDEVSSSEVRRRIARGEPWEDLVPEPVVQLVREIY